MVLDRPRPHAVSMVERAASFEATSTMLASAVDRGDLPGVVACAADVNGELYRGSFGLADRRRQAPMREETLFFIASMTKLVTHVAVMQLVEQGRLSLDKRAARFVPSLAGRKVLEGFDDGGAPILRPSRGEILIRHLLGYTAGFAYPYWNASIRRYVAWSGLPDSVSYRLRSLDLPLVGDPGDRWNYGIGTEFLGRIVERVSGERLDDYVRAHIFEPLGMSNTSYSVPPDQQHLIANVHARLADGSLKAIELTLPEEPEFYPGGVGLFSTALDYLKLTRMLLCDGILAGGRVLRPETVASMNQDLLDGVVMGPLQSCDPFWSCDVDLFAGQQTLWTAGLLMNTQPLATGRAASSMSWGGACNTFYWIDRVRGVTGVFMTSIIPFCEPRALGAFTRFEKSVYEML